MEPEPLIPPDTVIGDAERRKKLAKASLTVVGIAATVSVIAKAIPGPVGKILGFAAVGLEKDPGTGKLKPGAATPGIFAPSPFGFMDPTAVGLKRNFYLPSGSTDYIPRVADRLGLGLREQRAEDVIRKAELVRAAAGSLEKTAAARVEDESIETLRDLQAGRGGLTRSGLVIATGGVPIPDLQRAATEEIARRQTERTFLRRLIAAALAAREGPPEVVAATAIDTVFVVLPPDP